MSRVRVLVGTRKGAFILEADGKRENWNVSGPFFAGWEMYHLKGSPVDPNRIYASQTSGWFGQVIQRSNDGGKTWEAPGGDIKPEAGAMPPGKSNMFVYDTSAESGKPLTTHQWYDGTQHPWEFKRVWHIEPSVTEPDTVFAGVEDAALFKSTDGGTSWHELSGLRGHGTGPQWQPGAGGMCLHTVILDPSDPGRIYIAISAAGAFRTDDGGKTWKPINRGLRSQYIPDPRRGGRSLRAPHRHASPSAGRAVYAEALGRDAQRRCRRQLARGQRQSAHRLRLRRLTCTPTSRRRFTLCPSRAIASIFRWKASCASIAAARGGNEWEPLTKGLPQSDCYVNVLRDAMAVDSLDKCGVYFGTTGGQVYVSPDAGDSWKPIVHDLPAVLSVEVQTLP